MIGAIILAAGASRRMGRPKPLLEFGGQTFLERILGTCVRAGLEPRVVVLGADADKILSCHDLREAITVFNQEMDTGPIGSIRAGISCLNRAVEGVVAWHVDRPRIEVATVEALVRAYRGEGAAKIVIPEFRGQRGHPVLFGREVFGELLRAAREGGARNVVRADRRRVVTVPVSDPTVLEGIDTPEAYRRLLAQQRHSDYSC